MSLGSIVVRLTMNTADFETDAGRAAKVADKRAKEINESFRKAGVVIGTALSAAAIGITALVKNTIDGADAMRDLSIRTGVGIETLSAYGYAAEQTGTDIDTLAKGLKVLAKNAADGLNPTSEYAKVFDALGISLTDGEGKLRDLGQLFPEVADRIRTMEDGTTKAALVLSLFGRAGLDLTEMMNLGSAGLAEYTSRALELGRVIDAETGAAADDFNDTMGDLHAVVQGFALALAKDLLPDLQRLADGFRGTATEGNRVKDMAEDTASFLRGLGMVAGFVGNVFNIAGKSIAAFATGLDAMRKLASGDFKGALFTAMSGGQGITDAFKSAFGTDPAPGMFDNVRGNASTVSGNPVDMASLATALSNPTIPSAKKAGKSDAEKAAERLQSAYDSLIASQREQIALFGDTSEAAKVRYDTEHGELAGLAPELKAVAIANAERLDTLREEAEVVAQLNELEERRRQAVGEVLDGIQQERDLLGMTIEQQDTYNKLKWAGVDANSAAGRAIAAANHQLHEEAKAMAVAIDLQDEWRSGLSDAITDVVTGAKSMKEAFGDFFDDFAARITEAIANRWIEKLFGETGSNGGGSAGNIFSSILSAIGFGGGKASGGWTMPNTLYEVNERGFEMATVGNKDYMLTGSSPVKITPNHALGGVGVTQNIQFMLAGPVTRETQQQAAQRVAVAGARARSRNSR